ncbi:hypothetical protein LIER_26081 [Lithospermum erythrorhizon]|uniref:Uncharacterized protein n=1 Tax=Lithospermum erythrorhizon TaxID=34254 RepID=A0AAV3RA66_LITER
MAGKHVVDVDVKGVGKFDVAPEGEIVVLLIKAYEEEQQRLEAEIQLKKGKVVELQSKIQALKTTVPPAVNDPVPADVAEPEVVPSTVNDLVQADVAEPEVIPSTVNDPPSHGGDNPN